MNDTPRVTVPVDPIQRLILAADSYGVRYLDSDDMTAEAQELQDATEAMKDLISAPAPEGGAVSETELRDAIALILPMAKGYAAAHPVGSNQSYVDYVENLITTREEAPAEAGEDAEAVVRRWANWIIDESSDMDHDDHDAGKRKVRAERDLILSALRAQPPAREDAQPVQIDPATVETAIGGSYDMPDGRKFWIDVPVAREMTNRVLAALQAEQKGGA